MVVHAGVNPNQAGIATVILFDTKNGLTSEFSTHTVEWYNNDEVNDMFKEIRKNITGECGCISICLKGEYENKIRKKFISTGLRYGFQRVSLIDEFTAALYEAIIQVKYFPPNLNILWFITRNSVSIWQKNNDGKMVVVARDSENYFHKIISKLQNMKAKPDIILYFDDDFSQQTAETYFPQYPSFICKASRKYMKGILTAARILSRDSDLVPIKVGTSLCNTYTIELGRQILKKITYFETLPLRKSIFFYSTEEDNILRIWTEISHSLSEQSICLPRNKKFLLIFNIDINKVYSIYLQSITVFDSSMKQFRNERLLHYYIPKKIKNIFLSGTFQSSIVGIDLGTSRCCVAVKRRSGIETVALDNSGQRFLPSYVAFDEKNEKCGQVVIDRLRYHSKSTAFDLKRIIGRNYEEILQHNNNWPFKILNKSEQKLSINHFPEFQFQILEKNNIFIQLHGYNGIVCMHPEEIVGYLLKHIGQKVEEYQGIEHLEAVIAIPSAFTEAQKDATRIAANLAGWEKIWFLPEPVAAAFAYFIEKSVQNNSTVLIFDLGGGTLDICIFEIKNDEIQVIGTYGNSNIGGRDFDNILFEYVKYKLFIVFGILLSEEKYCKLLLQCQKIKESLSTCDSDIIDVEEFDPSCEGYMTITREDFEHIVVELFDLIRISIERALTEIGYKFHAIDKILLVGGGCRMPLVQALLKKDFPDAEHLFHQNLDELVAIGAAYYSAYLILSTKDAFYFDISQNFSYKFFNRRHSN